MEDRQRNEVVQMVVTDAELETFRPSTKQIEKNLSRREKFKHDPDDKVLCDKPTRTAFVAHVMCEFDYERLNLSEPRSVAQIINTMAYEYQWAFNKTQLMHVLVWACVTLDAQQGPGTCMLQIDFQEKKPDRTVEQVVADMSHHADKFMEEITTDMTDTEPHASDATAEQVVTDETQSKVPDVPDAPKEDEPISHPLQIQEVLERAKNYRDNGMPVGSGHGATVTAATIAATALNIWRKHGGTGAVSPDNIINDVMITNVWNVRSPSGLKRARALLKEAIEEIQKQNSVKLTGIDDLKDPLIGSSKTDQVLERARKYRVFGIPDCHGHGRTVTPMTIAAAAFNVWWHDGEDAARPDQIIDDVMSTHEWKTNAGETSLKKAHALLKVAIDKVQNAHCTVHADSNDDVPEEHDPIIKGITIQSIITRAGRYRLNESLLSDSTGGAVAATTIAAAALNFYRSDTAERRNVCDAVEHVINRYAWKGAKGAAPPRGKARKLLRHVIAKLEKETPTSSDVVEANPADFEDLAAMLGADAAGAKHPSNAEIEYNSKLFAKVKADEAKAAAIEQAAAERDASLHNALARIG